MTIKKIGLSALVAATLTTGVYAKATIDAGGFVHNGKNTYNTNFLAVTDKDLNTSKTDGSDGNGTSITGIAANKDEWVVFELTGAEFDTNTTYNLIDAAGTAGSQVHVNTDTDTLVNTNKLEFKLNKAIDASMKLVVSVGDTNSTDLILKKGATANVTMTAHGEDNLGNELKNSNTGAVTILEAKTTPEVTATLVCGKDGKDILINSDNKENFVANSSNPDSGADSTTTAKCLLTIPKIEAQGIDFKYNDNNISVTLSAGDFNDGNFSVTGTNETFKKIATAKTETFYDEDNSSLGADKEIKETIKFTVSGDPLLDTVFQGAVKVTYGDAENNVTKDLVTTTDVMKIQLSSYEATINALYADANQVEQIVVTNSSDKDSDIMVTVTQNGVTGAPTKVGEVKANSLTLITVKDIYKATNTNGLINIKLALPSVDAKKGDVTAMMANTAVGNGRVMIKVVDNNSANNGN
jgi:hypothetical protein